MSLVGAVPAHAGGWNEMICKVPSNPNHSMILCFGVLQSRARAFWSQPMVPLPGVSGCCRAGLGHKAWGTHRAPGQGQQGGMLQSSWGTGYLGCSGAAQGTGCWS